jgi:hypothetical protein
MPLQASCPLSRVSDRPAHRRQVKAPGFKVLAQRLILITYIAGDIFLLFFFYELNQML